MTDRDQDESLTNTAGIYRQSTELLQAAAVYSGDGCATGIAP